MDKKTFEKKLTSIHTKMSDLMREIEDLTATAGDDWMYIIGHLENVDTALTRNKRVLAAEIKILRDD